ncbi:aminopeptidase [Flavobacterium sp. PL002]|uniref:aminopeptidase n=1 Tax=Flavobacterium sp. PL002 TaxID=1897058 RepID=UPI0019FB7579|nr:hypothetical protein [Flavobacterium sp. PL002]
MKSHYLFLLSFFVLCLPIKQYAQHHTAMVVTANMDTKILTIDQELTFVNDSNDTLYQLVLNDWNNAYADVNTPLAKRFSDEFYRGFHLAQEAERGKTTIISIVDTGKFYYNWNRTDKNPDVVSITLRQPLLPHENITLKIAYTVKIPSAQFTKFGYEESGALVLKNWYLTPARYENHDFVIYSNENLDDIVNGATDLEITLKVPLGQEVTSDLKTELLSQDAQYSTYSLSGKNNINFGLFIAPKSAFYSFKNDALEVLTNIKETKISTIQQALLIDRVVSFTTDFIGKYPEDKIIVSQTDYDRNPFYGLNQLPAFISPFTNEFTYEIKFLKTYLNAYLKNSLRLDNRQDSWIYDGIQVYAMMKYIEINHPKSKMLGSTSRFKILKSYNLTNLDFNEQYSYFYMLMARKNLDQPLASSKNALVKFNEQIASKYRAGLSLRFLDNYLGNNIVGNSIQTFYKNNAFKQQNSHDFESLLKSNTTKDINWFFKTIINSRDLVDYKFGPATKTKDSVSFTIKNRTGVVVPVPIYGINKSGIVFKKWLEPKSSDTIFTIERKAADKLVLNYKNEVPEYNLRNNWKTLKGFFPNNRPIKFVFMKDLEDPYYNQILYVPSISYNLYDGLSPGLRLHNKTILEKPFLFDVNPAYSTKARSFSGSASFVVNQNYRESKLYNVRYSIGGSYFHYAPDATYLRITPTVQLRIRQEDYRDNRKQLILVRQVLVNKEKSLLLANQPAENYSVFNAKYFNTKTEVTNHLSFMTDLQLASQFGKLAAEIEYRKLFENNQQISLRLYAGSFLYNKTNSDYYSFALDRPTDYLFDYNYYGRSESTGFFSQQLIVAEGGFKSKLNTAYANQWITTLNGSYALFNWFEIYGDAGFIKNKTLKEQFLFDSGVRLNLVPDYFEIYLPIYSSNGWEIGQNKYNEKIRFIITLSPKILINLFNRKWF